MRHTDETGIAPAPNDLPDIVDGPGEYVTRDGRRVSIHEVKPSPAPDTTSFGAKGSVWGEFRGRVRPIGYAVWHASGRSMPLEERPSDIVGRWQGTLDADDGVEPETACEAPRFR